jgi:hypothetical protein
VDFVVFTVAMEGAFEDCAGSDWLSTVVASEVEFPDVVPSEENFELKVEPVPPLSPLGREVLEAFGAVCELLQLFLEAESRTSTPTPTASLNLL